MDHLDLLVAQHLHLALHRQGHQVLPALQDRLGLMEILVKPELMVNKDPLEEMENSKKCFKLIKK